MKPEVAKQILAEVKANHAKLDGCPSHDFAEIEPRKVIGGRYRCANCGGDIDAIAYSWYTKGLFHGAKRPTGKRVEILDGDDWEIAKVEGQQVLTGHRIRLDDLLKWLGIDVKRVFGHFDDNEEFVPDGEQ
jgi:hypothetical protein